MIVVSNRIPVRPDHADAFEKKFSERLGLVDKMQGFIAYRLLRPTADGAPYVVLTFWESEETFRAWTSSKEFREQHTKDRTLGPEAFTGPVQLEIHEVAQESGAKLLL